MMKLFLKNQHQDRALTLVTLLNHRSQLIKMPIPTSLLDRKLTAPQSEAGIIINDHPAPCCRHPHPHHRHRHDHNHGHDHDDPGCKSQHHGLRGRYQLLMTNPLLFVDLVSIIASTIFVLRLAALHQVQLYLNLNPKLSQVLVKTISQQLHWFRFFEFLRMFRIDRRAETWAMLGR